MKFFIVLLLVAVCAYSDRLTIAADLWPPFNGEPGSEREGILVEIARLAFESKGYEVDYKVIPWSRAIKEGENGRIDILVGAAKADAPGFVFPDVPQARLINSFFHIGDFEFKDLSSLRGKSLGVIQDYTYGELVSGEDIDQYIKVGDQVEVIGGEFPLDSAIQMLLAGRIDLLIEHPYTFRDALARNKLEESRFRSTGSVTKPQDLYLAISPKRQDAEVLADIITETTKELARSGHLDKLEEKYGLD